MTNPPSPRPEPTTDSGYDNYLVPRSKTPEKNRIYEALFDLGWRFDSHRVVWHTPEADTLQGFGRLEYDNALTWARIQPPAIDRDNPRGATLPPPLLNLTRTEDGTWKAEH